MPKSVHYIEGSIYRRWVGSGLGQPYVINSSMSSVVLFAGTMGVVQSTLRLWRDAVFLTLDLELG